MNLVQLAEHAKNLSDQQLQQMLQVPDGAVPPFILAAEAARRQDIARSAQVQPAQPSTVLDDLIQSRAQSAGLGQLASQMASPQAPQQMPQAAQPQMQPQAPQMRDGGQVRRFAEGSAVAPTFSSGFRGRYGAGGYNQYDQPQQSGFDWLFGEGIPSLGDYFNTAPTDPIVRERNAENAGMAGINILTPQEQAQDVAKMKRMQEYGYGAGAKAKTASPVAEPPPPKPNDPAATDKQVKTADKEAQMGATPSTTATPTTGNPVDDKSITDRIDAMAKAKNADYFLGMSPSTYAQIGAALLSTDPYMSNGQRWANAAAAMASGVDEANAAEAEAAREAELMRLKWDMEQYGEARQDQRSDRDYQRNRADKDIDWQRQKAADDERHQRSIDAARREATIAGYGTYIQKQEAEVKYYNDQIKQLMEPYTSGDMFTPMPDDVKIKIAQLETARDSAQGILNGYRDQLAQGVYSVNPIRVADPTTGRPQ